MIMLVIKGKVRQYQLLLEVENGQSTLHISTFSNDKTSKLKQLKNRKRKKNIF